MSLDEALKVREVIERARAKQCKSGLPAHLILLAGFTARFCEETGTKEVRRSDIERTHAWVREQWERRGSRPDDPFWGYRLTMEKLLEREGERLDLKEDLEESTEEPPAGGEPRSVSDT